LIVELCQQRRRDRHANHRSSPYEPSRNTLPSVRPANESTPSARAPNEQSYQTTSRNPFAPNGELVARPTPRSAHTSRPPP
jgi:hypothetical protein